MDRMVYPVFGRINQLDYTIINTDVRQKSERKKISSGFLRHGIQSLQRIILISFHLYFRHLEKPQHLQQRTSGKLQQLRASNPSNLLLIPASVAVATLQHTFRHTSLQYLSPQFLLANLSPTYILVLPVMMSSDARAPPPPPPSTIHQVTRDPQNLRSVEPTNSVRNLT